VVLQEDPDEPPQIIAVNPAYKVNPPSRKPRANGIARPSSTHEKKCLSTQTMSGSFFRSRA
jgi:hypothetical protein